MHFYLPKLQVPIIGVVWGERGLISWLLSRKFGSYLTHGALEAGAISAPDNPLRRIWGGASCRPYLELCDVSHVVRDVEPRPIIHVLRNVDPGPSFCSML